MIQCALLLLLLSQDVSVIQCMIEPEIVEFKVSGV